MPPRTVLLCCAGMLIASPALSSITYLGAGSIAANASDDTGLTGLLEDGSPGNLAGGMGSAIAYSGLGQLYFMIPDRGPGDGTTSWLDRMYDMQVAVTPSGPGFTVTPTLGHATLLTDESGAHFTGRSSEFDPTNSPGSLRLDPEGLRVGAGGTSFFVSDEFGPFIYEFGIASGTRLRWFALPPKFLVANPSADNLAELPPGNTSGRQSNRSMEGLAISPNGSKLYGLMQSPMLQDGALNGSNIRVGTNCRLLEMDIATGSTREFLYQLSDASIGATELLAINDHEFLVLERDGRGLNSSNSAQFKQIFRIDIAGATDISGVASLPKTATPAGVTPVSKVLFLDVLAATGISGSQFPEKLEGIAFGPNLGDGRHLLIVSADNDFKNNIASWFFAFAIDPQDLPGFVPQVIAPIVGVSAATGGVEFRLDKPVPDPAHGATLLGYALAQDGHVTLTLYDLRGRRVRQILDGFQPAGAGHVSWDCRDDAGHRVPVGIYFARIEENHTTRGRKLIVVE